MLADKCLGASSGAGGSGHTQPGSAWLWLLPLTARQDMIYGIECTAHGSGVGGKRVRVQRPGG